MDRNTQERFALNPVNIDIQRSRFTMSPETTTTFNLGKIYPLCKPIEVLPGDTFEIDTALAIRMQSLITPPFDNLHFDYYYFFVPNRVVWHHWKEFMGENNESAWIPSTTYTVPTIDFVGGATPGSVADYMGIPTSLPNTQHVIVDAMPFRGFAEIYNTWFRNENVCPPVNVSYDDVNRTALVSTDTNFNDPIISMELGGALPSASKTADYFTKALPAPQKGEDVMVFDHLPVYFGDTRTNDEVLAENDLRVSRMTYHSSGTTVTGASQGFMNVSGSAVLGSDHLYQPNNWYVDGELSINQLRLAFQIQKLYEKEARSGSRYIELLKSHFSVTSPDATLQRPQYLGGNRVDININAIYQTSETGSTPQGNPAGYSITGHCSSNVHNGSVLFSSTEHGYIHCIGVARIDQHKYQQGLHRSWTRRTKLDYYFPVLANIGEQPIKNSELYCQGLTSTELATTKATRNAVDNQVFGYQEAWAEYRYMPSIVTGEMRSNIPNSLDSWHFADDYNNLPSLSPGWLEESPTNIDRVLAVQSSISDQFLGDFLFSIKATRPMPLYSIPGLIDHH